MGKIFYTNKSAHSSEITLKRILSEFYGIPNAVILRTKNGKPYLENGPHFSISHTKEMLFLAFSNKNVGLDAELLSRKVDYASILKKFPPQESKEINDTKAFLRHWVVKESAVKYLGETLANSLQKLAFVENHLYYEDEELPLTPRIFEFEKHLLCVCADEDFTNTELIHLPTI